MLHTDGAHLPAQTGPAFVLLSVVADWERRASSDVPDLCQLTRAACGHHEKSARFDRQSLYRLRITAQDRATAIKIM
jgi:hypothetical protein